MNTINYRNEDTKLLCNKLDNEKINFKYVESGDKVMDDEMIVWSGKKNGLKIQICDSYVYTRNYFKVIKTGFKGDKPFEVEVYNGNSVSGVISTVKRILDLFKKRRDFYLKNRVVKK